MKLGWHNARLQALILAAIGGGVLLEARRLGGLERDTDSPGRFPLLVGVLILLCAVIIGREPSEPEATAVEDGRRLAGLALLILAYPAVLWLVPFPIASAVFLWAGFIWLRAMSWRKAILVALVSSGVITVVFRFGFQVILP